MFSHVNSVFFLLFFFISKFFFFFKYAYKVGKYSSESLCCLTSEQSLNLSTKYLFIAGNDYHKTDASQQSYNFLYRLSQFS